MLGALCATLLLGLPMRLALTMACCNVAPRSEIQKIVGGHIRPDDVVCSELDVFFEVKQSARIVYDTFYSSALLYMPFAGAHDFSPEEKLSLTVLVIRPSDAERITSMLGGQWRAVTAPFGDSQDYTKLTSLPLVGRRIASYSNQRQNERYQVQIFRRLGE